MAGIDSVRSREKNKNENAQSAYNYGSRESQPSNRKAMAWWRNGAGGTGEEIAGEQRVKEFPSSRNGN
jgi:hypothetical protein